MRWQSSWKSATVEVLLRDVHELELVGEEAPHERGAQAHLGGGREVPLLDPAVAEALERVGQLRERRVHALERVLEEGGLVLLDPALDAVEDLVLRQVPPGDAEGGVRRLRVRGPGGPRLRPVVVDALLVAGARAGTVERSRRSASSTPFQHRWLIILRPEPREQRAVGLAQEVEHHPPLRGGRARPAVDRQHALQAPARDEVADALGDRVEELALLREEGPLVRARASPPCSRPRPARRSRPAPRASDASLNGEGVEARRLVDPVARGRCARRTRPGTASRRECVRITSPRTSSSGRLLAAEELVDPVEAVQLLGPLLQVVEDAVDRLVGRRVHSLSVRVDDARAASGRPRAGRAAPACARAGRARCGPRSPARASQPQSTARAGVEGHGEVEDARSSTGCGRSASPGSAPGSSAAASPPRSRAPRRSGPSAPGCRARGRSSPSGRSRSAGRGGRPRRARG